MSLSEYEKTEFERLTACLDFRDSAALKEMERRERKTVTGFARFARISSWSGDMVAAMLTWLGLAMVPTAFLFLIVDNIAGVFATLLFGALTISVSDEAGKRVESRKRRS